jgi:sporulation protein YunB
LKKGPLPLRYVFLLTFVFFIFSTSAGLWIINEGLKPTLMSYAKSETRKIATLVISKAVNKKVAEGNNDEIIRSIPNTNGSANVQFDTEKITRMQSEIENLVQKNIKEAERGNLSVLESLTDVEIELEDSKDSEGIVYYVPLGQATNNALLGNLGPKIPIRFSAIGDVQSDVSTKVTEYGINNAHIEVIISLKVNIEIIIPFATDTTTVLRDIPIAMGVFPGAVPQFYNGDGNGGSSPSIELPAAE